LNKARGELTLLITILALLLGIIFSLAFVRLARTRGPEGEMRIYAIGLVVAAVIYLSFGLVNGASAVWLAIESFGIIIYGAVAWVGLRWRPSLLALGWAAHVAWDVLLHLYGAGAEYTPTWYPWLCISFDLVIAGAVLALVRRKQHGITARAG
jgi:hypothetical protein